MRWMNWIKLTVVLLMVGLVMGACGDRPEVDTVSAPDTVQPTEPVSSEAPVEATPAGVELGQGFWFAGFRVELGAATYDPALGLVTIDATFENLGSEPAVFDGTPSLAAGGSFYESSATQSLPTVPGMSTGSGELVFDVDEAFTFAGAVLTIGLADNNQRGPRPGAPSASIPACGRTDRRLLPMRDPAHGDVGAAQWWRDGVLYQLYPRSFADANGDGHGDLRGVIEHLDHLEWLGVDGIWLNPITVSPDADWGYDVSDYTAVDPDFGTIEDLDALVAGADGRGIRILMDLVPNHTSDRHPWFLDARSGREAARRDWYVWADGGEGGAPPNNWRSSFGGPAWTWDETTEQFYLHNFLPEQPDLNWWNDDVRGEFEQILRFWFDRGIAGFRIDVAHALVKDRSLRDDSIALDTDHPSVRRHGLRSDFSMNRPEGHDVLKRWRAIADTYDSGRVLLGETWVLDLEALARFYGEGDDELHLALNVPFVFSWPGEDMREIVERTESLLGHEAWPLWNGSNHDAGRFPSRWSDDDDRRARAAMVVLLTLRGTPLLYYGDEIGMPEVEVPRDRLRDPVGIRHWPENWGRDRSRTPMQWTARGGFTADDVEPWLPMGDATACNVADQRTDHDSMLHLCRDLIALRRKHPDLGNGTYEALSAPVGTWAWRRGGRTVVALNHGQRTATLSLGEATILIGTDRRRDGEPVEGELELDPWEAIVAETAD